MFNVPAKKSTGKDGTKAVQHSLDEIINKFPPSESKIDIPSNIIPFRPMLDKKVDDGNGDKYNPWKELGYN